MKLGLYKHYKGNIYRVIGLAKHTETEEKLVLYYALAGSPDLVEEFGERPFFVRPYNMFNGEVQTENGGIVPRFRFVEE